MASINESWHWLGPLLVGTFGTICVAVVVDLFKEEEG